MSKKYKWSSSNESVATVDENGKVTALAEGSADITVTTEVGGLVASCEVEVISNNNLILPGVFSVGPENDCKKVCFSRGNLKYTPNIEFWSFFDNQYEQGHSSSQVSLFTWGYGSWSANWQTGSFQSSGFTDWGSQIGDGNTWRTLTDDEWVYLLNDRTNAEDKCGFATVCGMHGIILLPDGYFDDPKTNTSTSTDCVDGAFVPMSSTGWGKNVYGSGDIWNSMESAGAVFLPAAGDREGSIIDHVGNIGFYWSSSAGNEQQAFSTDFASGSIGTSRKGECNYGYSVRLITECQ